MKHLKFFIIIGFLFISMSCDENKWLEEKPLDFYAPENSYNSVPQFRQALNYIYDVVRNFYFTADKDAVRGLLRMSDMAYFVLEYPDKRINNYLQWVRPDNAPIRVVWNICYDCIGSANAIISHIDGENEVEESSRKAIKGEALFFRAFWYRTLAYLYGGVPLIVEPVTEPKRDFVRATKEEVLSQCGLDLEEAISLLDDIDKVKDGQVSKQAAQHLITEIYLAEGKYTEAISSASAVINHPNMELMTERFGSRKTEEGDPYWDLFQLDNQNRSSGNKESILVLQYDYQNAGSVYGCFHPAFLLPEYINAKVVDNEGNLVAAFTDYTAQKGGSGEGEWRSTYLFTNTIWGDDFEKDLRNSDRMIVRDFKIDNPDAKGFGQWLVADGWLRKVDTLRHFYPFIMKFSRVGYFPEESYAKNSDGSPKITALGEDVLIYDEDLGTASCSFMDYYLFRLAGTYLLRAEAYLGNNQKDLAAADINALRNRAHASPITADDVTIDYILDEQMRELYFEDYRSLTLFRMGKFVEKMRKYNPQGYNVGDHQNLWPIPYSEIEKNIYADLEQNPGY